MFTGIVSDVGEIVAVESRASGRRMRIGTEYQAESMDLGASISCSGCCLTVVDRGSDPDGKKPYWFDVDVSEESLARTTAGTWQAGTRINLERALRMGDELGGHIVSGHVDATAEIVSREDHDDMAVFWFQVPPEFSKFVASKGSVSLDGTSLTVNLVEQNRFSVMLVPHTLSVTTWGGAKSGDLVNFEVDMLARYVARLAE